MQRLTNPYECRSDLVRTTVKIPAADSAYIGSLHKRKGTLQNTLYTLLDKTIATLKANGFNEYCPERYEDAIANLDIRIGGAVANNQPNGQAVEGYDGQRTGGMAQPVAAVSDSANEPSSGVDGQARKRKRSKKG